MKKTVEGKTYNTATAKLIGEWRNTLTVRNSNWCHEILFQTTEEEYFIWGCGGSLSAYRSGNSRSPGSKADITPLSRQEAKEWAQAHIKHELYVKEFGGNGQVA